MTGDLTTLANLKAWLGIAPGMTVSDDLLSRLISSCSTFIQSWLNRSIASTTYAETRNGPGGNRLLTLQYPIISVASVTVEGIPIQARGPLGPTMTGNGSPSFAFDSISIMVNGCGFVRGFQNVALSYVAGYATTPTDLEQACIDTCGDWFKYKDRIGQVGSFGIEGQTISFTDKDFPARAKGVLLQYKNTAPPA